MASVITHLRNSRCQTAQSSAAFSFLVPAGRRSAPPLNLTGLPGTEKLNEKEKEVRKGMKR